MPAARKEAAKRLNDGRSMKHMGQLLHQRFKTFAGKVAYVKKHLPQVEDAEAFVAKAIKAAGVER